MKMKLENIVVILWLFFQVGDSAKILGFFTTPSFSHQLVFQMISKQLAFSGHDVTFISPDIMEDKSLKTLKQIDIKQVYDFKSKCDVGQYLSKDALAFNRILGYYILTRDPTEIAYQDVNVQKLLKSNETFDVLILQGFHPLTFAIAAKFKAPVIGEWRLQYI